MKKTAGSIFLAWVLLTVLVGGCAPAPTPAPAPSTIPPAPIQPTSTATPIPITPTPYDEQASPDDQLRLDFFRKGGIWSFRASNTETEWTIAILAQKSALDSGPEVQLGSTTISSPEGLEGARKVLDLFSTDFKTWNAFMRLFADGIERGEFDAYLVTTVPISVGESVPISAAVTLTKDSFLELVIK